MTEIRSFAGPSSLGVAGGLRCLLAWCLGTFVRVSAWVFASPSRTWAAPIVLAVLATLIALPYDGSLSAAAASVSQQMGGDLRRELHAWQQFGAVGSILFTVIVLLAIPRSQASDSDRAARPLPPARRIPDLILAVAIAGVLCAALKVGVGRPRPREVFNDPQTFLGPFGVYPVPAKHAGEVGAERGYQLVHAWEYAGKNELWSMPSSHTVYAVVLAVFLSAVFPRLRLLWVFLAALVGLCRVLFDAHWPTDVIVGAGLGAAVAWTVASRQWGVGVLDWLWRRLVDPAAKPLRQPPWLR